MLCALYMSTLWNERARVLKLRSARLTRDASGSGNVNVHAQPAATSLSGWPTLLLRDICTLRAGPHPYATAQRAATAVNCKRTHTYRWGFEGYDAVWNRLGASSLHMPCTAEQRIQSSCILQAINSVDSLHVKRCTNCCDHSTALAPSSSTVRTSRTSLLAARRVRLQGVRLQVASAAVPATPSARQSMVGSAASSTCAAIPESGTDLKALAALLAGSAGSLLRRVLPSMVPQAGQAWRVSHGTAGLVLSSDADAAVSFDNSCMRARGNRPSETGARPGRDRWHCHWQGCILKGTRILEILKGLRGRSHRLSPLARQARGSDIDGLDGLRS